MKTLKQHEINESWNQAEEIYSSLMELTDSEIIENKQTITDRALSIMDMLGQHCTDWEE
jgi:hypothetical protein